MADNWCKKRYDTENDEKMAYKILVKGKEDIKFKRAKIFEAGQEDAGEGGRIGWKGCSWIPTPALETL